jgi:hypothetical protein
LSRKCELISQRCVEPHNETDPAFCECKEPEYVTVSDKNDHNNIKCERYDPCNVRHRNLSHEDENACGDAKAVCFVKENFNVLKQRDYYCVCPKNYQTNSGLS